MYLLFLDESGTHKASPVTIVAGIAVHEHDAWHLQRRLHDILARKLPANLDPLDFELHAGEMKSPQRYARQRRPSPWEQIPYPKRMDILSAAYRSLTSYVSHDSSFPVAMFGAVVDAAYMDQMERAYEEVLHKFDEMLTRQGHVTGQPHQRGLAIHDKAVV